MTGNGMSMVFESAELAIEPLARFSRGELSWSQAQQEIALACDLQFAQRLRWAAWLQQALFQTFLRSSLVFLAAHSSRIWHGMFARTR